MDQRNEDIDKRSSSTINSIFSNLYVGEKNSVDDVVLVLFTDWIISLVQTYDICVDICPIIVNKMLPKQDHKYRLTDLSSVIGYDIACLEKFRKLFRRLVEAKDGTFTVQSLQCDGTSDLFKSDKPVDKIYLEIFTWENPQGISIRPTDKHSSPVKPKKVRKSSIYFYYHKFKEIFQLTVVLESSFS